MIIRTLIVDDEPLACEILEGYVEQIPFLEHVGTCHNAIEANEILQSEDVDLLLLDVQMPQISGLDFLRSLKNPPNVILTTAFQEYAIEGFDLDVVDYLLKPIPFDRFMKAAGRVRDRMTQDPAQNEDPFFYVKSDKKLVKVDLHDVVFVEGLKDYVIIWRENDRIITLQTMKSLEDKFPSSIFQRIHRSFIVNIEHIEAIVGNMVEVTVKGERKQIPIGKNYRDKILSIINENKL
jgi:DNA-binding LytR/AlgR family response regulator